jgi:hypothetical protein
MPAIPAFRRLRQEDEFEASLGYIARLCLKYKAKKLQQANKRYLQNNCSGKYHCEKVCIIYYHFNHLQIYNLVPLNIFTTFCNRHQCLCSKLFHHLQQSRVCVCVCVVLGIEMRVFMLLGSSVLFEPCPSPLLLVVFQIGSLAFAWTDVRL